MAARTIPSLLLAALVVPVIAAAAEQGASPCTDGSHPEYRQADFWIGNWDVASATRHVSTVTILKAVNGCAFSEVWSTERGDSSGLITYSPSTHKWDYLFVTPSGVVIRLADGVASGSDFKFNQAVPVDGKTHHWSLSRLPDGTLRELSVGSSDGGTTWTTDYDFKWTKKK